MYQSQNATLFATVADWHSTSTDVIPYEQSSPQLAETDLIAPISEIYAARLPIEIHLEAFGEHLVAKGNTALHAQQTVKRVEVSVATMKWRTIDKIDPASVEEFIARLRKEQNLSLQNCNHYIRAIKIFCNWMVKRDKLLRHNGGVIKPRKRSHFSTRPSNSRTPTDWK